MRKRDASAIYAEFFNDMLELYPSLGSYLGKRQYDDRYEDYCSAQTTTLWKRLIARYQHMMRTMQNDSVQAKAFSWFLKNEKEKASHQLGGGDRLLPISSYENRIVSMVFNNRTTYPLKTKTDVDNLIKRYDAMIGIMQTCVSSMMEGIARGIVLPSVVCRATVRDLKAFSRNEEYVIELPGTLKTPNQQTQRYQEVLRRYASALTGVITFMENTYLPKCRDTLGMCYLPDGKRNYEKVVVAETTLNVKPAEVFAFGCQEVARLRKEFDKLRQQLGYSKLTHVQFCKRIMGDPKQYAKTVQELLSYYKAQGKRIADTVMMDNFHDSTTLKQAYEIKPVPKDMDGSAAGAFYYSGNYQKRKGVFYVNTRDLMENPLYSAYVLSLHEGQPGHHFQFQSMIERNVPEHCVFAFDANGFVEGWALYAETLGDYAPLELFGKLSYEMLRSARLVVDVGIHYHGWSWAKALKYMISNVPIHQAEIETELMRYVCMPGQAVSYKMGERLFKQLGEAFLSSNTKYSIKDYHEAVLENGIIPLEVLKDHFKNTYNVKLPRY